MPALSRPFDPPARGSRTPAARPEADGPFRILVVDDSAVIRGLLTRVLEADPEVSVVASVGNGKMAISAVGRQPIDVVVLDIEMPVMDGLTALPQILKASPKTKVIIASTLTKRNADVSIRALRDGASDYITKPSSTRDLHSADAFKRDLLAKVKALGLAARGRKPGPGFRPDGARGATAERTRAPLRTAGPVKTLPMPSAFRPEVLAIGSSTGGPQALFTVLSSLGGPPRVPILLTQHMPATFTTILAEHLSRQTGVPAVEAVDRMPIKPGRVHVAPGDYHMLVEPTGTGAILRLSQSAPVNFCRPAVDPMMDSLVRVYGGRVLSLILTGMGHDGLGGCRQVSGKGGVVVAQDEATSTVWGMPGAVSHAGIANAILPLGEIGPFLRRLIAR